MQKILIIFVSFTLFLSFVSFQTVPKHVFANTQTITVNEEIVNVRQGPGLTYEVVRTLHKGDTLTVLASEGDWLKVQNGRVEGWIANWLVTTSEKQTTNGEQYVISQVDHLNIRQQPSVSSAVIDQLFTGNEANFIKQDGDWIQIQYGATVGWVAKAYVTIATKSKEQAETKNDKQAQYFTISVDAVNVRTEGSLHSKKIGVAYRGSKYKVLKTTDNWVQIQYENNTKAWIYSFYGNLNGQAMSPSSDVKSPQGTVTIIYNGTNLRQEASTTSAVVQRVNAGQAFAIVGNEGDFYKIDINGEHAYVANWVVSTNGQTGQAPQTSTEAEKNANRKAGTLQGVTLVIDSGHGGNDHGTTGVRGTREKEITLLTAEKLTSKLRAAGATVYLTRESDTYVDLRKRVAVSHQVAADAFISIHYDANENSSINGFTTYYTNGYQKELANYVHNGLSKKLAIHDRGVQYGNYLVLRENRQQSILIELGFLSNANEERTITTDYYREQATLGMYEGILNYFDAHL